MKGTKLSIVFCHRIWADGSCFSKVIPAVQAEGHECIAPNTAVQSFSSATVTADSSPLYEPSNRAKAVGYKLAPSSANYAVRWYLAHGVEAQKIVLGVPFYGHEWTDVSRQNDGLFEAYKTHVTTDDPLPYRSFNPSSRLFGATGMNRRKRRGCTSHPPAPWSALMTSVP